MTNEPSPQAVSIPVEPDKRWILAQAENLSGGKDETSIKALAWNLSIYHRRLVEKCDAASPALAAETGGEAVAWRYQWTPHQFEQWSGWTVGVSDPRIYGGRRYRNVHPLYAAPPAAGGGLTTEDLRERVSDETMRALLSCKDVGSGRAHLASILAALSTTPARAEAQDEGAATDDLVDRFAVALKAKLRAAGEKYGFDDAWKADDWRDKLIEDLLRHVQKGDPRDVAAYCAFAWHHDWSLSPKQDDLRSAAFTDRGAEDRYVSQDEGAAGELKPCPFCGGEAEIIHLDDGDNAGGSCVCCTKCQASGNVEFGRKENFVDNWNRRAHPSPTPSPDADRVRIAVEAEAEFLVERLSDFENEDLGEDASRQWMGHVSPSLCRLRQHLAALKAEGK